VTSPSPSAAALRAWFVSGDARATDGSRIVRCEHQARAVRLAGGQATVTYLGDSAELRIGPGDVVVLSRCPFCQESVDLVRRARAVRATVLADFDDLIFCPWLADRTGASRSAALRGAAEAREQSTRAVQYDYLRLLPAVDATLVSTPALREALAALGLVGHVVRNALDLERCRPLRRKRTALRRLLFMTGTATHDADFATIADELRGFLLRRPAVALTLLGPLAAPAALAGLTNVQRVGKLPPGRLLPFVAEHDLCLVPLENTPFNDSKSALKFLECGCVSVPVLASPRREYRELIRHGETGLLAEGGAAFVDALEALLAAPEQLDPLARAAHDEVLLAHDLGARAPELVSAIERARGSARPRPLPSGGLA
jgi:O-antigen biosynthesis protein